VLRYLDEPPQPETTNIFINGIPKQTSKVPAPEPAAEPAPSPEHVVDQPVAELDEEPQVEEVYVHSDHGEGPVAVEEAPNEQVADILTKPLGQKSFEFVRKCLGMTDNPAVEIKGKC